MADDNAPSPAEAAPPKLGELVRLQPWRWFAALAFDWAVIAAAMAAARWLHHPLGYVVAVFVVGTRQNALGLLDHDAAHRLVTRNGRFDDLLAQLLCFGPVGILLKQWRAFHWDHHRHTGSALDPELLGKANDAPQWDLPASRSRILRTFLLDLTGWGFRDIVRLRKGTPVTVEITGKDRFMKNVSLLALLAGTALTGTLWVFGLWMAALLTSGWAVSRLRLLSEHVGTAGTHRLRARWWERAVFLPHNTWAHFEHHRYPSVPFYHLPAARELDRETPVLTLSEVFDAFERSPAIPSGQPLAA